MSSAKKTFRKVRKDWLALNKRYPKKSLRQQLTNLEETRYASNYLAAHFSSIGATWSSREYIEAVALGDDIFNNRNGRRIAVTEFYMIGALIGGANNLTALDDRYNVVRIVGTVSQSATNPVATGNISDIIGKRMEGVLVEQKFVDKLIALPSVGGDTTGIIPACKIIKIYKRFKKPVIVDYSEGGVPNKRFWVSMISDSSGVPNPGFTLGHISFNFKDI